ncbi:MAG: RNase adapter RapZ [Sneathiella sp.]|nr:RNase adapter RapZ [Sneathiella sp.]
MTTNLTRIVLITGLSGAGKSTTLKQFEDLGWEVADNIPISLLAPMVREIAREGGRSIAVGVDTRTRGFTSEKVLSLIGELKDDPTNDVRLLFLDCDAAKLQQRFTETRRRHPMAADRPVMDGIMQEKKLLRPIAEEADDLIDSTLLALPELRQQLISRYSLDDRPALSITVTSFSFKKGLPREADLVFDMRFLRNPYYDPDLREKTGEQKEVADYIAQDPAFAPFVTQLKAMMDLLLPRYLEEGKSYLTIAIGCTGGRHRSVCVAEIINDHIERNGYLTHLVHRDRP